MRGDPRHHLSSKVLCWIALDRAVKLADQLGMHADVEHWATGREMIRVAGSTSISVSVGLVVAVAISTGYGGDTSRSSPS
jgi:hypothetical protein